MRIAIITPFYPPSIGGVETIACNTAEELTFRGHEVSVITTTCNNAWEKIAEFEVEIRNNVTVYRLKPSFLKIGYATSMKGLKRILKKLEPDIVHCHNLHPHLFQAAKWKNELGFEVIAQLHYPEVTGIDHLLAKLMYHITIRHLVKKQSEIDTFIVHTNLERDWLVCKGIEEEKVRKLNYPCVPYKLLEYNQKPTHISELASKYMLLYVGRITWRKGVHTFLEALAEITSEISNVTAVVAGPRDKKYYKALLRLVDKLNLRDYVVFKQQLSEQKKYEYMKRCTVFVSPSIKDLHPITLVEAQALCRPVISTTVGAIREIVKDGETGLLVEPENPEQLAQAIKFIVSNENERMNIGVVANQWIKKNFLLEATINELEKLYTDCLS